MVTSGNNGRIQRRRSRITIWSINYYMPDTILIHYMPETIDSINCFRHIMYQLIHYNIIARTHNPRLFQSCCSTHYGSILWPLHDRGFNDFCVTWNKGARRMLNVSNMTHTALLGQIINTVTYIINSNFH